MVVLRTFNLNFRVNVGKHNVSWIPCHMDFSQIQQKVDVSLLSPQARLRLQGLLSFKLAQLLGSTCSSEKIPAGFDERALTFDGEI